MNKYIVWIEDATVGGIEEAAVANPDVQNVYFVDHTIGIMWKKCQQESGTTVGMTQVDFI